jgi:hypothetical protein
MRADLWVQGVLLNPTLVLSTDGIGKEDEA